jgi:hypothetical protein
LREFKWKEYNIEDELKVLQYEPEIPITRDCWNPDADEIALLTKEPKNDKLQKTRDEIIARGGEARKTSFWSLRLLWWLICMWIKLWMKLQCCKGRRCNLRS